MHVLVQKIFGIDSRSLGLARIFLGLILVIDTLSKLYYAKDFYTDQGVLPRIPYVRDYMGNWAFSLHLASGELWFQVLLLSIGILFSFLFMIGYRWRRSAIIAFVLLCSMQNRNFAVLSGADDVLRLFLFWFMFMPSPGDFAVDKLKSQPQLISSFASAALMLQLLIIYFFTAIWKMHPVYTQEYSAVYYSLNLDYFAKPMGVWLRQWFFLTKILTIGTIFLESIGPVLALFTWWPLRFAAAISFQFFHLGLFATLALGTFSWIMMAYWTIFFPGKVWDWKAFRVLEIGLDNAATFLRERWLSAAPEERAPLIPQVVRYKAVELMSLSFLILVVAYNASGVTDNPRLKISDSLEHIAQTANVNQKWWMFAPRPSRSDGWFVVTGTFDNGETVDLLTGREPIVTKPEYLADFYSAEEWQTYMLRLWQDDDEVLIEPYAKYMCRKFANDPQRNGASVQYIEVDFYEEYTPPMGKAFTPIKHHHLWSHVCFD